MPESMRIIDAHTHIAAEKAETAVRIMDAAGIAAAVVCEWHHGFGQALQQHLRQFAGFEGRFFVFGNIDFSRIDAPDFGLRAAEGLRRGVQAGMRGLKVYKNLGLELTDASGELLRLDDARLDPIWAAAGELGIPVLLHTADPRAFWEPIDRQNPWGAILRHWPEWSYYRKGLPSRDELLAERNALLRRHGKTNFIAPHLGSLEDNFGALAETLQALPNFHVDIAARFYHMAVTGRRRQAARKLCVEFADRILFGTDSILLSDTAETVVQPQTFLTGDRLPPRLAGAGDAMLLATSVWFYEFHKAFLETDQLQRPIPFLCHDPATALAGLDLPQDVLHKLYHGNIERLLGVQTQR